MFILAIIATLVMIYSMVQEGFALWTIIVSGGSMFIAIIGFMTIQRQLTRSKGK